MAEKITYQQAGVDIKEGYRAVAGMKSHVQRTHNANVLTDIGSFGGLFQLPMKDLNEPVLVSGTDGVGTKLKVAFMADTHHTVGIDLVAMCVNDILCQGAKPLFFLDYLATGKLNADQVTELVAGIADGCVEAGCALIGGETAEMPGFYSAGEYDMAGFSVGVVDRKKIIDGTTITAGDKVIGIAATGFHSNGFSLIRKLIFDVGGLQLADIYPGTDQLVRDVLLMPTAIYVKPILDLIAQIDIKGAAHITGGGFIENIPRALPKGLSVKIDRAAWQVPAIYNTLQRLGNLSNDDMFNTFNMGIGFVLVVNDNDSARALEIIKAHDFNAYTIGQVVTGDEGLLL